MALEGACSSHGSGKRGVPRNPSADQRILELVAHGMHHSTQDGDPNTKRTSGGFKMALLPVFFFKKGKVKKNNLFFKAHWSDSGMKSGAGYEYAMVPDAK